MRRLEALADALMYHSGYHDPTSESYRARNPGLLKAWSLKHLRTEQNYRIFRSFLDGYQALLYDLRIKCSGQSRAPLHAQSTLSDLLAVYNFAPTTVQFVVRFLRKALEDESITSTTPIVTFLED